MDVTPEIISLYVDGQLPAEQAAEVERALGRDEVARAEAADLRALEELFGSVEPEPLSDGLRERLYALRPVERLQRFEALPAPAQPVRRVRWANWAVAAAALVVAAFGLRTLTHRPEVVLRDVTRLALDAHGDVAGPAHTFAELTRRSGDRLRTGAHERLSFRTAGGAMVVLQPGSELVLGDPRDRELFELGHGTALCTVPEQRDGELRAVVAGGFVLRTREANFGVRVREASRGAAGVAASGDGETEVTVAVSRGRVEIGEDGVREVLEAYEAIELRPGAPGHRAHAATDPMYYALMRRFHELSAEIVPGYFTGERGVVVTPARRWARQGAKRVLVVTDGGRDAVHARYLVLYARTSARGALRLTLVKPYADRPGLAETTSVRTAPVGTDWQIVAVPLDSFGAGGDAGRAERGQRAVPPGRSRLARLELEALDPGVRVELRTTLWAERPPADLSEVVR